MKIRIASHAYRMLCLRAFIWDVTVDELLEYLINEALNDEMRMS